MTVALSHGAHRREQPAASARYQRTGLDIPRTDKVVMLQVTSRPRSEEMKVAFYRLLCEMLEARCDIKPTDVMVNFIINSDADWSFGLGRAQFLTGDLRPPWDCTTVH